MKKFIILVLIFIGTTGYIYSKYAIEKEQNQEGDLLVHDIKDFNLGGKVKTPNNDTISIGKLQTSYIQYTKGDITFDDMVKENMNNLTKVLNYPFNPKPGYLFSVGYDEDSKIQFYYQSNQEETRTVIIRVENGKELNKVDKIYDGSYYKLVSIDGVDPTILVAYDSENEEHIIGVN